MGGDPGLQKIKNAPQKSGVFSDSFFDSFKTVKKRSKVCKSASDKNKNIAQKNRHPFKNGGFPLVRPMRFERTTFRVGGWRSSNSLPIINQRFCNHFTHHDSHFDSLTSFFRSFWRCFARQFGAFSGSGAHTLYAPFFHPNAPSMTWLF